MFGLVDFDFVWLGVFCFYVYVLLCILWFLHGLLFVVCLVGLFAFVGFLILLLWSVMSICVWYGLDCVCLLCLDSLLVGLLFLICLGLDLLFCCVFCFYMI